MNIAPSLPGEHEGYMPGDSAMILKPKPCRVLCRRV